MNRILVVLFLILPAVSAADEPYNLGTGIAHIPVVRVGADNYEVEMVHQGNLLFRVISVMPTSITTTFPGVFDSATEALHIPRITVGAVSYEVDMAHQGDLVFNVTSAEVKGDFAGPPVASGSFNIIGTDPSSAGYSYLASYESENTTQLILSPITAFSSVVNVLDSIQLDYRIDRSTGIITIADSITLKPDYLLTSLITEQQTLLKQQPYLPGVTSRFI
jgi:hypothetical protein